MEKHSKRILKYILSSLISLIAFKVLKIFSGLLLETGKSMRLKMLLHGHRAQLLFGAQLESGQAQMRASLHGNFLITFTWHLPTSQRARISSWVRKQSDQFAVSNLRLASIVLAEVQCVFEYSKWMEIRQRQTLSRVRRVPGVTLCRSHLKTRLETWFHFKIRPINMQRGPRGECVLNFGSCLISKVTKAICYWTQLWPIDQYQ